MSTASCVETLDWDVLSHIITFLGRPDVSRLTRTCRALHAVGIRQLLYDPIELWSDNIVSFYACVQGDAASHRGLFVRELNINCSLSRPRQRSDRDERGCGAENLPVSQLLAGILQRTTRLQRLEPDWAAAGLSSYLRDSAELRIPFVSQALWEDLKHLRAPLRPLSIQFGPMQDSPVVDPVPLLARFSSTLEELDLSGVQFKARTTEYPRVRKLSISDCYCDFLLGGIDLAPVRAAFPNVTELSFSAAKVHPEASQWLEGRSCDKPELVERCRRSNRKSGRGQAGVWKHLERVTVGHVLDLYMLGLGMHVPHVEIKMLSESTIHMMQDVLEDTRPSSLALSLFAVDPGVDYIPQVLPSSGATDCLSSVALTLLCTRPAIDVDKVVHNLSAMPLPRRAERLAIHLRRWDTAGAYYLNDDDLPAIDAFLDQLTATSDHVVRSLAQGNPMLRTAALRIGQR
ncbi:hypothetical protein BV20DRAFT_1035369 [Pilatotrama ljubarskyi]|nr:hypothetical protein BV20DRAFT_1035369 [Pilatotrama ljubarskyi]